MRPNCIKKKNESLEHKLEHKLVENITLFRNPLKISLLILSEFKQINWLLFPLKSSENL